ncbi:MAG: DUF3048 domain-containing protein [Clostridia bacterium]|nr:DUF3048 domain-containing protein [Clostridia bacterium]
MLKKLAIFLLILILALTAACAGDTKGGKTTETMKEEPKETKVVPEPVKPQEPKSEPPKESKSDFLFPKEGIRPFAVMIDNEGLKSLPQGGLDKAQVIYEIIVEGGETRLMPVFWGTEPTMIGSVRSSRHYFLDYAMEHDAIYVHFGWSPMAQRDISKFKINNINGVANGGEIFWDLTKDKYNWQDSYTSAEKIKEYIKKANYRTNSDSKPVFQYNNSDMELTAGSMAQKIDITYSAGYTCGFEYDTASKMYKRIRKGKPQIERVTEAQLTAKNIIVQTVGSNTIKGDDKGRQEIANLGTGNGWLITDGKAQKIKWSKESRPSQTKYVDESGNAIKLNPGQTWVQIVPAGGRVDIK